MASVIIRVGASRDASLSTVFQPLEAAAKKARNTLAAEAKATAAAEVRETQRAAKAREKEYAALFDEIAKKEKEASRVASREENDRVRSAEKAMREKIRISEQEAKAFDRAEAQKTKAAEKAARAEQRSATVAARAQSRAAGAMAVSQAHANEPGELRVGKFGFNTKGMMGSPGRVAAQTVRTALSYGGRAAVGGFQAAGVDTSLGSAIGKGVSLESAATKVSNSGYMPGHDGQNGQRQDPTALANEVRKVANSTATDTGVAMDALDKFVAKTGDLATGRDMLQQLAVLSKATGADLSDMADAAGDVANNLGEGVADKGKATVDVLRLITAQGKEGAVEIKDLASQMAKVASAASMFEGDKGKNIAEFGALTQFTRAKGGAASSTQAATSVTSFQNTFSKGARLKAFKGFGVNVQGENGKNRDAEDVILDSIQAAATKKGGMKNFNENMGDMFKDVRARSVTKGFESTFQDKYAAAQGTEQERITAAIAGTRAEFDKLKTATMDDAQVADSFAAAMRTTESQATILSNRIADSSAALGTALNPAIAETAKALVPLAAWLSTNLTQLTGSNETKKSADDNQLEIQAAQAGAKVRDEMRAGAVKPEDAAAFQQLFTQLQDRKAQLDKTGGDHRVITNMDIFDKLTGNGGARQSAIANDKTETASLQRSVDFLAKTMADLAAKGITAMPPTGAAAPPAVDQRGRTPGVTGAPPR